MDAADHLLVIMLAISLIRLRWSRKQGWW